MLKTNERGFTIVELLTSFALATVVMVFLFNILLIIKKDYMVKKLDIDFSTQQSLLSDALNKDATNCPIEQIFKKDNTFSIVFQGGKNCPSSISTVVLEERRITYNGIIYNFPEGVTINVAASSAELKKINNLSYYYLNIPISLEFYSTGEKKDTSLTSFYIMKNI